MRAASTKYRELVHSVRETQHASGCIWAPCVGQGVAGMQLAPLSVIELSWRNIPGWFNNMSTIDLLAWATPD